MQRRLGYLFSLLAGAAIVAAIPAMSAAPKPCPKGKLARIVNGKRTCVLRATFRPSRTPESVATARFRVLISRVNTPKPKVPSKAPRPMPATLQRAAVAGFASMERTLTDAVRAAMTKSTNGRAQTTGTPGPSVTLNPDGSASGQFGRTIEIGGHSITIGLEVGGKPDGSMTIEATTSYTDANGTQVTTRMTVRPGLSDPAFCPSETGAFPLRESKGWTATKTETFGTDRIKAGVVRLAFSGDFTRKVQAQLNADAVLQPIPFTITASNEFVFSFQGAAFLQARYRITANATMNGTIDPTTGALTNATVKTTTKEVGPADAARAKLKSQVLANLEEQLRDVTGQIFKDAREVEARAQGGGCTHITLLPETGSLQPGETTTVNARLDKNTNVDITTVKWTASAAKGSVSPPAKSGNNLFFSVVGAAPEPQTASIKFRAVSPAGISEATWVGTGGGPPRLHITATGTFTGSDLDVDAAVSGTIEYDAVRRVGEPENYDLLTPTHWTNLAQTLTVHSTCPIVAATPISVFAQPASSAATRLNGTITVFLLPAIAAQYNRTTNPPSCLRPTALAQIFVTTATAPGLNIATTAGVPTRVTGSGFGSTYDITVTVTELTQ